MGKIAQSIIGNPFNTESANIIAHDDYFNSLQSRLLAHGIASAVAAEIAGGSGKGTGAGAFAAELAAITLGDNFKSEANYQTTMLNIGKVTGQ